MEHFALKYLRKDRLPHIFCPGCGIGIIMNCFCKAVDELNLDLDKLVLTSGIGCSSRVPGYFLLDSLHTTHGRSLAFATGIKLANPELTVVNFTGDGDLAAIGGNHFIHACRRNIDITVICVNNQIYGMTGGQVSPTTPEGFRATTAPYGNIENPFDLCKLAVAAGASYVARWTTAHPFQLARAIKKGIETKGLAFIEVISQCYTYFGRMNNFKSNTELLKYIKENSVVKAKAERMDKEELKGKIIVGEFVNREREEYTDKYYKMLEKCKVIR
ncbi:2-oxoacid:ferredoxin oxidoreductase subunit beta [Methanocaldococcus indicus]|uniref:2-oxoacid:ferredoxin oxidoreductase subunit beta n=1 Tax=Methanocaldococcus indicus TaxID=213231 RepID=UPI003C6D6980